MPSFHDNEIPICSENGHAVSVDALIEQIRIMAAPHFSDVAANVVRLAFDALCEENVTAIPPSDITENKPTADPAKTLALVPQGWGEYAVYTDYKPLHDAIRRGEIRKLIYPDPRAVGTLVSMECYRMIQQEIEELKNNPEWMEIPC